MKSWNKNMAKKTSDDNRQDRIGHEPTNATRRNILWKLSRRLKKIKPVARIA